MLSTLERIAPDTGRIDLLVELVDKLRPPHPSQGEITAANVRALSLLLKGNPDLAARLGASLCTLLEQRRHASLYTDIGILSNDGFVVELKRRIAYRFLPPALDDSYLSDAIDQVLYVDTDYRWVNAVPTADWLELFDVIAAATPRDARAAARATIVLRHARRHPHAVVPGLRARPRTAPDPQQSRHRDLRLAVPDAEHRGQRLPRRLRQHAGRRRRPRRKTRATCW